jgi:membrane peptidoglycan carboxypeptidase
VENLVNFSKTMGITTWDDPTRFGLSLTLGGGEVKMTDLATAYGVFANSGSRVDLQPILEVKDHDGHILEQHICNAPACETNQVLDPKIAFLISDILSDNTARTPTFGPYSQLYIPKSVVAVKTGTTNNLRDNWTIGYTPDFLAAVWVGNDDNSPIWRRITDYLLKIYPSPGFSPPSDLLRIPVCLTTDQLPCTACPGKLEYFLPGTQPKTSCSDDVINRDRLLEGASTQR